jgi:hypothetical protein
MALTNRQAKAFLGIARVDWIIRFMVSKRSTESSSFCAAGVRPWPLL